MEKMRGSEDDEEKWVHDSSVDSNGNLPLRASTGAWKAALFIITIEFSERLSYFGIATNLITYLTKVMHQDLKTAAKNVNYWSGVTTVLPLVGAFLGDAYTGRFAMVLLSSVVYLLGLGLLTMSQYLPSLKPCGSSSTCPQPRKIHEVIFFLAMYMISVGTSGHKPCLESFGADQFDDDHKRERKQKMSYFNWWNTALCSGLLLGVTVIVYVQDNVSWGTANLVLTITMAVTIVTFFAGRPYYRYRLVQGSPLTPMFQVLVASIRKRKLPLPLNPSVLYEVPESQNTRGTRLLCHTNNLRFLDKAAIVEDNAMVREAKIDPWRLVTVTRVEEMKLLVNMVPIWLTCITFGVCVAQASTFFIKQGAMMDRKLGPGSFQIPPASIFALGAVGMILSVTLYEKLLVPVLRKATGNERGLNILQRIGIGMIFSTASMAAAALVENKRLGSSDNEVMSVFWLAPQYMILGIGDGFTLVGLQEYFYDQVPDSMRSLGIAFYLSVLGVGSFCSSFLIIVVDKVTGKGGGGSWFGKDLNSSRLDHFYWLLAVLMALDLCVYVVLARRYTYKNVQRSGVVSDFNDEGNGLEMVA